MNKIPNDINAIHAKPKTPGAVYFLGIGGIGMSAIARYYNSKGVRVSGYDKTPTVLTRTLEQEGISIHYTDDIALADTNADFIVYTPAIPQQHAELKYFKDNGFTLYKRSDVLGMITSNTFNICIAGTHGKTTTSAMVAHILMHSKFGCTAFLGGVASNYGTNFMQSYNGVCVVEADEYDRSFLKLQPDVAVVTTMDADHLDIYGTEESMQDAFLEFVAGVKPGGTLIVKSDIKRLKEFKASNVLTYSLENTSANIYASDLQMHDGSYRFNAHVNGEMIQALVLHMGGMHNVENALAAIAVAKQLTINPEAIKEALATFTGVKRRFEYVLKSKNFVLIDDYAHHPEELRALISGAKKLFPGKYCTVVFQPHLFSRTQDHVAGFAEVLSIADETILLPIYPARELPIPGVQSSIIEERMSNATHAIINHSDVVSYFENWQTHTEGDVVIVAGAGDIDTLVLPLKKTFENKIV